MFLSVLILFASSGNSVLSSSFDLIKTYDHDATCFTQGLVYEGEYLYESCGLNGESMVKKLDRKTFKLLQSTPFGREIFAEGLTYYNGYLFMLTYKNKKVYIINADSMNIVGVKKIFTSTSEGWGITHNHNHLIVSDGSSNLFYYDFPDSNSLDDSNKSRILHRVNTVQVKEYRSKSPVDHVNELEYVNGYIYANLWYQDRIVKIDPVTGYVVNSYDLSKLYPVRSRRRGSDCLNGIAYDQQLNVFLITGKKWPYQYHVQFPNTTDINIAASQTAAVGVDRSRERDLRPI